MKIACILEHLVHWLKRARIVSQETLIANHLLNIIEQIGNLIYNTINKIFDLIIIIVVVIHFT